VLLFLTVGKLELFMMTHTVSCSRSSDVIRGLSQGAKITWRGPTGHSRWAY